MFFAKKSHKLLSFFTPLAQIFFCIEQKAPQLKNKPKVENSTHTLTFVKLTVII